MRSPLTVTNDSPIILTEGESTNQPFSFDKELAIERMLRVYKAYATKIGLFSIYNGATAPQNKNRPGQKVTLQFDLNLSDDHEDHPHRFQTPTEVVPGSLEHILWLFFAVLTDRRQVSDEVYRAHVLIHAKHPEFYTEDVLKLDLKKFSDFLIKYKIGVPRQSAEYWLRCAKILFEEFDGNPINIIKRCGGTVDGVQSYKKEMEKKGLDPLAGYGPKITSLFLLYLAELDVYPMPTDAFPVDVHVQRFFLQQGLIIPKKDLVNDDLEKVLRPFICETSKKYNLDKVILSHGLWNLGAKGCVGCAKRKSTHLMCPVNETCDGCVNSKQYFKLGIWPKDLDFMRKGSDRKFILPDGALFESM